MTKFILNIFIFLIIIISTHHPLYATNDDVKSGVYDAKIRIINGDKYFKAVREEIKRAKQSIYVAMYIMVSTGKERNPVAVLVDELIKAHKRGVDVNIILEDSYFWMSHKTYKRLLDEGIWIRLDSPHKILHSKVVVIETFINLIEEYGYEDVKHAVLETSDYKMQLGLRDISVVINKLKGE